MADVQGNYAVQLIVKDPWIQSLPDTVTVGFVNIKPVANTGSSQSVTVGTTVTLNGNGSTDANSDTLTYKWTLTSVPAGSVAMIANPTAKITTFVPDKAGTYVVQLVVNDGYMDSDPGTIQIQVVTQQTMAVITVQATETQVTSVNITAFKNTTMQNALLNKLHAVIANIQAGNYAGCPESIAERYFRQDRWLRNIRGAGQQRLD